MSNRAFYESPLNEFLQHSPASIIGSITQKHTQSLEFQQTGAWEKQISILQQQLATLNDSSSHVFFEFLIPRMGSRADVILTYQGIIFVIEFKVGAKDFLQHDLRQVHGYSLDLKNFHKGSHNKFIVPILVATESPSPPHHIQFASDMVAEPIVSNGENLHSLIINFAKTHSQVAFDGHNWASSGYMPTPTIIEAAQALYANHAVEDITRSEADTQNLGVTSKQIVELIHHARVNREKIICFVTGVPGAGKTLVGLNIANFHSNPEDNEYSVFLSGNGPLVDVLQEALAIDKHAREGGSKANARRSTQQFIQNIHRFRDEALDGSIPPEKVAIFDEAQRAWNAEQASKFMQTKRNLPDFNQSEPEFLIEVMDRHNDWAVIVALIGGGQEINTGEAGLSGWLNALSNRFSHWKVYCSDQFLSGDYVAINVEKAQLEKAVLLPSLHLSTSMRSFRAETLSSFVHHVIAGNTSQAKALSENLKAQYPLVISRDLNTAKSWLKEHSRANESKGLLASSNAIRLKPEGIYIKNKIEPINWFLSPHEDIRSSHFLEDAATEFDIQGLELDWCLVGWDADFRYNGCHFEHWRFKGTKWQSRRKLEDQRYLENAYRVLLTRARQGMVVFIPKGDESDPTRACANYDHTFDYLINCGFKYID